MRIPTLMVILGGLIAAVAVEPALAQREPILVIPGRPGVPVMVNGRDVSYAVIEGEFGLDRPGHMGLTIISNGPAVVWGREAGGYYPATGQPPRYGRREVIPPANRILPPPAPGFTREWLSQSGPEPATIQPPYDPPQVIYAPEARNTPRPRRKTH